MIKVWRWWLQYIYTDLTVQYTLISVYCEPGLEGTDVVCQPCRDDYYKSVGGKTACKRCTGQKTSSKNDRTQCTVCK